MWHVVVPVKGGATAKSRLMLEPSRRTRLAAAMAQDTLAAVRGASTVDTVTALCGGSPAFALPRGVELLVEPPTPTGLNALLEWALHRADGRPNVAVVVADLPALKPSDLDLVLRAGSTAPTGVVIDRHGNGSTVLTASDHPLVPLFGPDSATHHLARGAAPLHAPATVRCDVDTLEDLAFAVELGLGTCSREVLDDLG